MKNTLKKYFIPHEENNYHPHILHTKRILFYSFLFILIKSIVVGTALFMPDAVYVSEDVMAAEQSKIIELTNELRSTKGLSTLDENSLLNLSALLKADDMADKQYFSHANPDGKRLAYFLDTAGYNYSIAGENLAMGYSDVNELFQAWLDSPTHYNNLIDEDYLETGLAIIPGLYNNIPTTYAAHHFGKPKVVKQKAEILETGTSTPILVAIEPARVEEVLSEKEKPKKSNPPIYNTDTSYLTWEDTDEDQLALQAVVDVSGDIENAFVNIRQYTIPLTLNIDGLYRGETIIPETSDNFFSVVMPGIITIQGADGSILEENISWTYVKILDKSPEQKYTMAKSRLGTFTSIFDTSKNIYLIFLIFFAIALALKISIEIKKQHPHVILQTCALLTILTAMYLF
ncbi:CAP domain-containing protein [Patescibacteria group bacterium]|nr:CAP domain-containing protein [Patescibacteria group bacterium]MBU1895599.1 CAP domain-containing protein [Patescibacteria group bacterium]